MNSQMTRPAERKRAWRVSVVALSALALLSFATTIYQEGAKHAAIDEMNESKLTAERLLGEKLQLEKTIVELNGTIVRGDQALSASERKASELLLRVEAAVLHARGLEAAARKGNKAVREATELRAQQQQLDLQLTASRANERNAQEQLDRILKERDMLLARMEEMGQAARMVNNAAVEALQGRKHRLTVRARRTNEIRMAFDLPEAMAKGASFKIITPAGRNFTGADPEISLADGGTDDGGMASTLLVPMSVPMERAARVHLRFKPQSKLEAGTYRIDVLSDGAYLNTVLLNLR